MRASTSTRFRSSSGFGVTMLAMSQADEIWQLRQATMEVWYDALAADEVGALEALAYELRPHAGFLSGLSGRVLDVGGGAGLAGMFLSQGVEYFVIDPSDTWTTATWSRIRGRMAPDGPEPCFLTGMAEEMPYPDGWFDAALAFWSLNHTADPARCFAEIHRVLRPEGRALIVLEDMVPSWTDIAKLALQEARGRLRVEARDRLHWHQDAIGASSESARRKLRGDWPLQDDHIRISDREIGRWRAGRFSQERREWIDGFLCVELTKL